MARLTLKDRKVIAKMYAEEESNLAIAVKLNVHPSTIYEELKRGYTGEVDEFNRRVYDPELAQRKVQENARRQGVRKRRPGRRL